MGGIAWKTSLHARWGAGVEDDISLLWEGAYPEVAIPYVGFRQRIEALLLNMWLSLLQGLSHFDIRTEGHRTIVAYRHSSGGGQTHASQASGTDYFSHATPSRTAITFIRASVKFLAGRFLYISYPAW